MTWTGRQEGLEPVQFFDHLYESKVENIEFVVPPTKNITIRKLIPHEFLVPSTGTITTRKLIPHGTCKVYEGKAVEYMAIDLKSDDQSSDYFIQISDPTVTNLFQFPDSFLTGDRITIKADNVKKYADYNVRFKEVRMETNDGSCTNYPTKQFTNYSDCIDTVIRKEMMPVMGCMVPWVSNKDVCKQPLVRGPETKAIASWLRYIIINAYGGIHYEHHLCPLPCSVLKARAIFRQSGSGLVYQQHNQLELHFQASMDVERILIAYGIMDLLVETGSCIGLWLGLSIVGVFDMAAIAVQLAAKLFKQLHNGVE